MARSMTISTKHLSLEEVEAEYRAAKGRSRQRWQVIKLALQGYPSAEIADITGYTQSHVGKLVRDYNEQGPEVMPDARADNTGRPSLLDEATRAALAEALEGPPPQGGLWNGPKVARWMELRLGHPVHDARGWEALRSLGYSYKSTRPRHADAASEEEQAAWKKKSGRGDRGCAAGTSTGPGEPVGDG